MVQYVTNVHQIYSWIHQLMECVSKLVNCQNMETARQENVIHVRSHVMSVIQQQNVNHAFKDIWFIKVNVLREMNACKEHIWIHLSHNV